MAKTKSKLLEKLHHMYQYLTLERTISLSRFLLGLSAVCLSCSDFEIQVKDELISRKPEGLLEANDYVVTGYYVSSDTIAHLGRINYIDGDYQSEADFFLLEYHFRPIQKYKGRDDLTNLFLWNIEYTRTHDQTTTIFSLSKEEKYLVYGNIIISSEDIPRVMEREATITTMNGKLALLPSSLRHESNTALFRQLQTNEFLISLLSQRNQDGQVIYFSEKNTFMGFQTGSFNFAFYIGRLLTPERYLEKLALISQAE